MTIKYIKKSILKEEGWFGPIFSTWYRFKNGHKDLPHPKKIPYGSRPYIISFCNKCNRQTIHKLYNQTFEDFIFECDFCHRLENRE